MKQTFLQRAGLVFASTLYILKIVSACLLVVLLIEGILRLVHAGYKPIIPYRLTNQVPHLPANSKFYSSLAGGVKGEYVTDDQGARILNAEVRSHSRSGEIFVVGDSQPLGWGMDFESTFASQIASAVLSDPAKARILGSPGTDVEHEAFAITKYAEQCDGRLKAAILTLNLGNDLDEMFVGRQTLGLESSNNLTFWLNMNSFLYMDINLLKSRIFSADPRPTPGINTVLYALLPDEQEVLADQAVKASMECIKHMPPSEKVIVLVIPNDYQVDPTQIDKYRIFYKSDRDFQQWKSRIEEFVGTMNLIEGRIVAGLRAQGVSLVSFSELAKSSQSSDGIFDSYSHHLTPKGHQLVSTALIPLVDR